MSVTPRHLGARQTPTASTQRGRLNAGDVILHVCLAWAVEQLAVRSVQADTGCLVQNA